jgi:hypothetical protein
MYSGNSKKYKFVGNDDKCIWTAIEELHNNYIGRNNERDLKPQD